EVLGGAMDGDILTVNAGSSSVKVAVFRAGGQGDAEPWRTAEVEGLTTAPHATGRAADGRDLFDERWPAGDGPRDHGAALAWLLPRLTADVAGWPPAAG